MKYDGVFLASTFFLMGIFLKDFLHVENAGLRNILIHLPVAKLLPVNFRKTASNNIFIFIWGGKRSTVIAAEYSLSPLISIRVRHLILLYGDCELIW